MMINKNKSRPIEMIKYLRILTLALILLTANNLHALTNETLKDTIPPQDEKCPITICDEKGNRENPLFIKYLSDNIRYPESAQEKGISGIIRATFDVSSEGEVSNIQITKGRVNWLKKEVLKLIKKLPNEIALLRTGGKEAKGVELSVSFEIRNEISNGTSFNSEEKTDIKVVAVRM